MITWNELLMELVDQNRISLDSYDLFSDKEEDPTPWCIYHGNIEDCTCK